MSITRNFDIDVNTDAVARRMKIEGNSDILQTIQEEIRHCRLLMAPQCTIEKIDIRAVGKDSVTLDNGVIFEGGFIAEKLARCSSGAITVCTLGPAIDNYIDGCFEHGDYLRGITADMIAVEALGVLGRKLWNVLVDEVKPSGFGITSRLSPGDNPPEESSPDTGWALSEQTKLFQCLRGSNTGITLLDSCMMKPVKSASAVYGFGEGISITRFGHVCGECSLKDCAYRQEACLTVRTEGGETAVKAGTGDNLCEVLQKNKLIGNAPCGGKGICGKCRVKITAGAPLPTLDDEKHLTAAELDGGWRLACRTAVNGSMTLYVPGQNSRYAILTEGEERAVEIKPSVIKNHLHLKNPDISDSRSDVRRIADGLGIAEMPVSLSLLRELSGTLRSARYDVTAVLYNGMLIGLEPGDTEAACWGVAADIGTTTVVCFLVNLANGKTIDVEAQANRQSIHGTDVISRISYTAEHEHGTNELRELIVNQLNEMISSLCDRCGILSRSIYHMTAAGNATMIHLLLGLPTESIAAAPFTPVTTGALNYTAAETGLCIGGVISILPGISGYVGSDITAGILASGMAESEKMTLLLDLGTNGEMALGNRSRITACSVAAGPAFEGGNIGQGVGGVRGAVCKVDLSDKPAYRTIGGEVPVGICGSGILDAVSEFLKHGIISETGRMAGPETNDSRLVEENGIRKFILETDPPIAVTQKDIREIQLAKAAFAAGIYVLLKVMDLGFKDIDRVFLAGGFGSYMDIVSALNIGLIPGELKGRITSIGNAAGTGAKQYLLSKSCREKAVHIASLASPVELSANSEFQNTFIENMNFN